MSGTNRSLRLPAVTWSRLGVAWLAVAACVVWGSALPGDSATIAILAFVGIVVSIIWAAFGVVKEADHLAEILGEPYGTLILTISIVMIEVILISAVMLGPAESSAIARDSIFSVMMIILNLVVGICMLVGGLKHGEQEYNAQGAQTYIGMIVLLGGIAFLLPTFGLAGGMYTTGQAWIVALLVMMLYGSFLWLQMRNYAYLYMQPRPGMMRISYQEYHENPAAFRFDDVPHSAPNSGVSDVVPSRRSEILLASLVLVLLMIPIALLAHYLAVVVDYGLNVAQLPEVLGGILIAVIVFTPESITAIRATLNNESQRMVNLCHGAYVSTVGLTIPIVLFISIFTGKSLVFLISPIEVMLLTVSMLLLFISYSGRRTTPILGLMHLTLFAIFIMMVFN